MMEAAKEEADCRQDEEMLMRACLTVLLCDKAGSYAMPSSFLPACLGRS